MLISVFAARSQFVSPLARVLEQTNMVLRAVLHATGFFHLCRQQVINEYPGAAP